MVAGQVCELDFLTHHEAAHAAVAFSFGLRLAPIHIDKYKDRATRSCRSPRLFRAPLKPIAPLVRPV